MANTYNDTDWSVDTNTSATDLTSSNVDVTLDGTLQINDTLTVGVDDIGHDVKFFGATSGSYMLWDESTDDLLLIGSSKLGIGTATPQQNLDVADAAGGIISVTRADSGITAGEALGRIYFGGTDDSNDVGAYINGFANQTWDAGTSAGSYLVFGTCADDATSVSERMRIADDGNVGIGTTAPANLLHLYQASGVMDGKITVGTLGDTEITSWQCMSKKSGGSNRYSQLGVIYNSGSESDETCGFIRLDQTDGGTLYMWSQNDNDVQVSNVVGNIGTTNGTAIGAQTSDERLKNISNDAFPYGLAEVNKLTPIKYTFKSNPSKTKIGFGAQTTQAIIPECVYNSGTCPDGYSQDLYTSDDDEVKNGKKEVGDEKGTQTPKSNEKDKLYMQYAEIIPVLVKAIQELSVKVTALETS